MTRYQADRTGPVITKDGTEVPYDALGPTGAPIGPLRLAVTFGEGSVYVLLSRGSWDLLAISSWDPEPHLSSLPKSAERPLRNWAKQLALRLRAADTGDLGYVSIQPGQERAQTLDDTDIDDESPYRQPLSIIRMAYRVLTRLVDSLETDR